MAQALIDYYEVLQVSANAEPETIQRVYRMLAQRFHPDNGETGDVERFRVVREAYVVLSDPEARARHDAELRAGRDWTSQPATEGLWADDDIEFEQNARIMMLEMLYMRRRREPGDPGLYDLELEQLLAVPREHLEFTTWFLIEKRLVRRATDSSRLLITAEGVEYVEQHAARGARRRLRAAQTGPESVVKN